MAQTVLEALNGVSSYPIPLRTLTTVADKRGLQLTAEATQEVLSGKAFNLAIADLLLWLSIAPDVSQGGQNYSFTDEQRKQFRNRANSLYGEYDAADETGTPKPIYGYKGNRI